jgi:hypothetical protein
MYKYHSCTKYLCIKIIILHYLIMTQYMHTLEPDPEEQVEPTPIDNITNSFHVQGKSRCIPRVILVFSFESLICNKLDCVVH